MFHHWHIDNYASSLLYLLNLLLSRLYLPAVGLYKLISIVDSLHNISNVIFILVQALLNDLNCLNVVILATLVLRLQVF